MARSRTRIWLALAILLGLSARAALLQGLVCPVRVAEASMAESLRGDYLEWSCGDCGFPCRFDADEPPRDERIVCPNCGCVHRGLSGARSHRGDRVLIDRAAYLWRAPQRWDVVALRDPQDERRLAVKRVVGLPGEVVQFRDGDLYINGHIQRKSLEQLRSLATLVYDSRFEPPAESGLPPRWAAESLSSDWRHRGQAFRHASGMSPPAFSSPRPEDEYDWLTYRQWRCFAGPLPRTGEYPVLDNCGYNQNESRQLQRVTDLLLVCRVRFESAPDSRALRFRADDGRDRFEVSLLPALRLGALYRNDSFVQIFGLPWADYARGVKCELALCDQRVSFAIDERVVLEHDYTPSSGAFQPTSRPLAVGVSRAAIMVSHLQIWRDAYYLDPVSLPRDWVMLQALAADQFFVVGDNVSRSRDSRQYPGHGVPRHLFLGKVLRGR